MPEQALFVCPAPGRGAGWPSGVLVVQGGYTEAYVMGVEPLVDEPYVEGDYGFRVALDATDLFKSWLHVGQSTGERHA